MRFSLRSGLLVLVTAVGLVLTGASTASAADDPLTVTGSGASVEIQPGLIGTAAVSIRNTTAAAIDDVYLTYESTVADSGLTPAGPSAGTTYYDPTCAQPGGAGSAVVCGPYSIPANSSIGRNLAYSLRSDFLLDFGQTPFGVRAGVSSAALGFDSGMGTSWTQRVSTDLYMQTALKVVDAGAAPADRPSVPSSGSYQVTSPQDRDIHWIITQGGYSDVQNIQASLTLPAGVTLRSVPESCTLTGSTLNCVWARANSGTFATIVVPITVDAGLPAGTVIPIAAPSATLVSPNEAPGNKTTWTASVVGAPYQLTVVPSVDLAVSHTRVDPVTGGSTISLPIAFANQDTLNDAANAVGTVSLTGLDFTAVTTTIPGCTVTGADLSCALGTLAAGASVTGTVDVTLPAVDSGSFTLTASISSDTTERNPADNTLTEVYTLATAVDPVPTPEPTPDPTVDPSGEPSADPSVDPTPTATATADAPATVIPAQTVLARTGVQVAGAVLIAVLLLGGGVLLLVARRGHRRG